METELQSFAAAAQPALDKFTGAPALPTAARVYALRQKSLVPGIAVLPAILGCLVLSGAMGLTVSAGRSAAESTTVEKVSPQNAETIWKNEVTPAQGQAFHLTLDLRNTLRATTVRGDRVLWQQQLPAVAASSAPVVFSNKDKVFVSVATAIGAVYMISARNGQILWMQNVGNRIEVSPLQTKNSVITVACTDGRIYGLNTGDGHIEYMVQTDSVITALEPVADGHGEHIYAVADERRILALNAKTGDLQWRRDTYGTVSDSPVLAANNIITPTSEGNASKLWAFDASGELRWINTFDRYNSLTAADNYIAMAQGNLVTLIRAETGEPVHYWQLENSPADIELTRQGGHVAVKTDQGVLISALN